MEAKYCIFTVFVLFSSSCFYISSILGEIRKPNVVLITVNEFGFRNMNYYWEYLKNIKKLSKDSIQFSHVYSQLYPTSSRAALLTGRLPIKSGMLKGRFLPFTSFPSIASSGGLPLSEQTLAELLKRNGYRSKFVGLWDQGVGSKNKFLPLNQGFRTWFGVVTQHSESCSSRQENPKGISLNEPVSLILYGMLWSLFVVISLWCLFFLKAKLIALLIILGIVLYVTNNKTTFIMVRSCVLYKDNFIVAQPYDLERITLHFTDEAVGFVKIPEYPFFLMVNHLALSMPLFSSPLFKNISGKSDMFLDSLVELDWSLGSIMLAIEHLNMTNDTIFVFTSLSGDMSVYGRKCNSSFNVLGNEDDCHGHPGQGNSSTPGNWERQLHVPLFIKWPNVLQAGKTVTQTVTLMDVMPTILHLTNSSYSNDALNGKSMLGLINGTVESLHSYIFHYLDVTRPSAVTYNMKKVFYSSITENGVVRHDPPLLFNIRDDPEEISPLPVEDYQDLLMNVSEAWERHIENKTRKWISQFEYPILPWLFPCAKFPYCYKRDVGKLRHIVINETKLLN